MIQEPLSGPVKNAVNILRTLINEREAMPEQISEMGWRYGGSKFLYALNQLREVLLHEGINADQCKTMHFIHGANVHNYTRSLLLIPVNGTAHLGQGVTMEPGWSYYTEDVKRPLIGERLDVICVVSEEDEE